MISLEINWLSAPRYRMPKVAFNEPADQFHVIAVIAAIEPCGVCRRATPAS
jgi:hypothetical protein